jgi:hypothetical protein
MAMEQGVSWAFSEAPRSQWLDPRQIRSSIRSLERLHDNAGASYSQALGQDGRQAARRLFHHERVTVDDILSGHFAETSARCAAHERVLVAQDTTEIDYGGHRGSKTELGPMAGKGSWGLLAHSALAMTEDGLPLGTLSLWLWARDPEESGKKHDRRSRATAEKESRKWLETLACVERRLAAGARAVVIADSESDVYDYLAAPRQETTDLLVRACQPRVVQVWAGDGFTRLGTLFECGSQTKEVGGLEVRIPRHGARAERIAHLRLSAMEVHIARPAGRQLASSASRVKLTLVRAWEPSPPEGEEAIEWWLLTTVEATELEWASRVVGWYARRWQIEVLHKVLKTGLGVEQLQIAEAGALMNALATYWIVAWRILWLTHIARTSPETAAEEVLDSAELEVVRALSRCAVETASDVVRVVARLGGHEGYRNGPPPGPKRLWEGLRRIHDMLLGWQLARHGGPL